MATDTLVLSRMLFYGHHGVDPREQELGQQYEVDIELELNTAAAAASDAVEDTVDYRDAYAIAEAVMVRQRCRLVETLADRIATGCLSALRVAAVTVCVRKLQPPLEGLVGHVEVRARRTRAGGVA